MSTRASDMREQISRAAHRRDLEADEREIERLRRRRDRQSGDGRLEAGWQRLAKDVFGPEEGQS